MAGEAEGGTRLTKPTFRTSERTNERVRRLSGAVTVQTGRAPRANDLIAALVTLGERHTSELLAILAGSAGGK